MDEIWGPGEGGVQAKKWTVPCVDLKTVTDDAVWVFDHQLYPSLPSRS